MEIRFCIFRIEMKMDLNGWVIPFTMNTKLYTLLWSINTLSVSRHHLNKKIYDEYLKTNECIFKYLLSYCDKHIFGSGYFLNSICLIWNCLIIIIFLQEHTFRWTV